MSLDKNSHRQQNTPGSIIMIFISNIDDVEKTNANAKNVSPQSQEQKAQLESNASEVTSIPRLRKADRQQLEPRPRIIDELVEANHTVRVVWEFVSVLDLSPLLDEIRSVEGHAGRCAIDPAILMALWLYATIEGVTSARELAQLCREHNAYYWLCGGVLPNYHSLSDFRVNHADFLEHQLTVSVATLLSEDLVDLKRVAQDGVKVRASAGAASFRRKNTLEKHLEEAQAHLEKLRSQEENLPNQTNRCKSARERAARERHERVNKALEQLPEVEAKKKKKEDKEKARVSTTDPDTRVMKMADGGFRPAFNAQFCTDTKSQIIVGVDVSNLGSDQGQMPPMIEQMELRYDKRPDEFLVDGGFVNFDTIQTVGSQGTVIYAPVSKPRDETRDPYVPLPNDPEEVAKWRKRMGSDNAKSIYKLRAATAECVNAIARNRGLQQFSVRGLPKVKTVLLWFALAHNMMRTVSLRLKNAQLVV